jgi:predicted HAD superfamily Cof-like phosphohydrolase|tara:strand:- start:401 stop:775 length:375 start_codon:yes stop_codon:yes gene_type:complete
MTNAEKVKEFMEAFGQEVKESPELADHKTACLRLKLILEEFEELEDAQAEGHLVGIADALSDLLYVVYGTAHTFGIPIDKCFEEVHNSNMSKRSVDGNPIFRDDGKVLKGPNFYEPDLKGILNE